MTVPQGEYINKLYGHYNNTIDSLKSVDSLRINYLKQATSKYDSLTSAYTQTTKSYKKQETDSLKASNKEDLRDKIFGYVLLVTLMVFVNDIMNQ